MKFIVKDNEIGFLFRNGCYVKHLPSGVYHYPIYRGYAVVAVNKKERLEQAGIDTWQLQRDEKLAQQLQNLSVFDNQVTFHFVDGMFYELLFPGQHTFCRQPYRHTFIGCDCNDMEVPPEIDRAVFGSEVFLKQGKNLVTQYVVGDGCEGALFCNGKFCRMLPCGQYWFLTKNNGVEVRIVDKKIRMLPISGQELLTSDKVELRINFVLSYRIEDAFKAATLYQNYEEQLYLLFQLALRELVSTKTLDELLAQKHEIGRILMQTLKDREADFGAEFLEAGIKDIILPGEVKEILNTVLIAEKRALANVITRREETASTRSLLNTAKLMEENQTLYRLKELEYLERICDKVGSISLSNNGSVVEQLTKLIQK